MTAHRVLIVSHGHPDFSLGGGEIAAYAQWAELRRRGVEALLVSRVHYATGAAGAWFSNRSADGREVLFSAPATDHFRHSQPNLEVVYSAFRELLERFRPTTVHFHHYVHLGLELVREVRKFGPAVRIVMTLHEFLAICHAQGQMLKTNGVLCSKAAPLDCHLCFPSISPQDFFMREMFVKSFLNLVDAFVSPSEFLRDRYVAWGLAAARVHVVENGQPLDPQLPAAPTDDEKLKCSFVALGQLSHRKGTLVLLEAARLLSKRMAHKLRIEIHGTAQHAEHEFAAQCAQACKGLKDTVRMYGPYRPTDVGAIIRQHGWVIQPSVWWENSPLVIQEAFACGRPVICSNVGGMAEKVQHGVNGLHFRVSNAGDLAATLERCVSDDTLWKKLCVGVVRPPSIVETVDRLLALY